eukprot:542895_1
MTTQSTHYDERFLWRSGSLCSVYSRSHQRWYKGVIADIFIEDESHQEWLSVQYNNKCKNIQRLCRDIKPISTAATAVNTVWMIGDNKYSECGITLAHDYSTELMLCQPQHIEIGNIIGIERGLGFNIFCCGTYFDELLVFGFIKSYASHKYALAIPNNIRLQILDYFGANYNRYWSCGANDFGQCCIGHCESSVSHIQPITYPMGNISKLCIGPASRNVLWLQNDGTMYINGRNLHKHIPTMEITVPIACHIGSTRNKNLSLMCVDGASSHFHSMVVCADGSVWSLGRGAHGELGHGRHPKLLTEFFTKVKSLNKYHMKSVSAGNYFSLVLSDDGNVWSCGINTSAQCGLGYCDDDRNRLPTKIDYFERTKIKIMSIECGDSHSIALSNRGKVYVWGNNHKGQCAINKSIEELVTIPTLIKYLSKKRTVRIKAGSCHSACVTADDKYFIWGCNHRNECCLYAANCTMIFKPHCINHYVCDKTSATNIVDISLGACNTLIIVNNKHI